MVSDHSCFYSKYQGAASAVGGFTISATDIIADPQYIELVDETSANYMKIKGVSPAATISDTGSYAGSQGIGTTPMSAKMWMFY